MKKKKSVKRIGFLTKKQVKALNRAIDRAGQSKLKSGECRQVSINNVIVCRSPKGYAILTSPHARARAPGVLAPRSRRLSPYYDTRNPNK